MKKTTIALGIITNVIISPLYAANDCADFTGTYAGSCANFPPEFTQVRSVIDQQGCDNVQVSLDVIVTAENQFIPDPVGTKFVLRTLDMHPGNNTETFIREENDTNTVTTYKRHSYWSPQKTTLSVFENTHIAVNDFTVFNQDLVGDFFYDATDNTMNLDITKGENEPTSSGDCKLFKLP